jgi:transcriptional regulator with GAF, ATPase, and Fis domain
VLPGIPNEYYRCLILLDCYPMASESQRGHYLALVDKYRERLAARARLCAENYQHKTDLIDAERLRVLDLDQLLQQLMMLALQSTGAQRGFLISEQQDDLLIEVSALTDAGSLQIERCACSIDDGVILASVIRYMARTLSPVLLADVSDSEQFAGGPYLRANPVKSLLCLPLHNEHSRHAAFLYLEHRQIADAFSPAHVAAARLLAAQGAAALANARLYSQLQQEVGQHRQTETELQQALTEVAGLKEKLTAENVYLQQEIHSSHNFEEVVGQSQQLQQLLQQVELVAATDASVLILGETGTGKELIARAVHQRSPRRQRPLIKVNCAALPATLIESELFGHEKGAFTGAASRQIGRFELADGGTLFLDEVGDLPLELQAKLLRVLQEGEFERLGSGQTHKVDVRIIAATNRELERLVQQGQYRADLYYRLSTFPVLLPPLRERREDIPLLMWYFIGKHQGRLGRHIGKVPAAAMQALQNYDWPGNIRELENIIERALIVSRGDTLLLNDALLPGGNRMTKPANPTQEYAGLQQIGHDYQQVERDHIIGVLQQCDWKIQGDGHAAERLGLAPSTLRWKMRKLGITRS